MAKWQSLWRVVQWSSDRATPGYVVLVSVDVVVVNLVMVVIECVGVGCLVVVDVRRRAKSSDYTLLREPCVVVSCGPTCGVGCGVGCGIGYDFGCDVGCGI